MKKFADNIEQKKKKDKVYYDKDGRLIIKPYRMVDLEYIYGISAASIKRWFEPYPELMRHKKQYYTLQQIKFIMDNIGFPFKLNVVIDLNNTALPEILPL